MSTDVAPSGVGSSGAALGLGALTSAVVVLPALPRVVAAGAHPLAAWLGLAGGTALVVGPLVLLLRSARLSELVAPLLGVALATAPLAVLGGVLKATTHHRPLGAATFGVLAPAIVLVCVLVSARVAALSRTRPGTLGRALFGLVLLAALLGMSGVLVALLRTPAARPLLGDGLSLLAGVLLGRAALTKPGVARVVGRFWLALWITLIAAGVALALGEPGRLIRLEAPVLGGPLLWL